MIKARRRATPRAARACGSTKTTQHLRVIFARQKGREELRAWLRAAVPRHN